MSRKMGKWFSRYFSSSGEIKLNKRDCDEREEIWVSVKRKNQNNRAEHVRRTVTFIVWSNVEMETSPLSAGKFSFLSRCIFSLPRAFPAFVFFSNSSLSSTCRRKSYTPRSERISFIARGMQALCILNSGRYRQTTKLLLFWLFTNSLDPIISNSYRKNLNYAKLHDDFSREPIKALRHHQLYINSWRFVRW